MNKRMVMWMFALLMTATFALTGCNRDPWASVPDPLPEGAHPHVVLHDNVQNRVSHGNPIITPSDGTTPMRVTVPLRLLHNREHHIQYRFVFRDERGRTVPPDMGWRFMTLPPRAQTEVEAAALNNEAVDWRLEIRLAR